MDKKKYNILLPPFLIIGILVIYFLPVEQMYMALFVPLLFWVSYYSWVEVEKRKKEKNGENK